MKYKKAALLIAAALFFSFAQCPSLPISAATTNSELKNLEDKLALATKAREDAEKAVKTAKAEKADAIKSKEAIDKQISAISEEMSTLEQIIAGYEADIAVKNLDIESETEKLETLKKVVRERARIKHEEGGMDLLTLLFDSDGLVDFFVGLDRFNCMLDYDDRLMESYTSTLEELEGLKSGLEESKKGVESQRDTLAEKDLKSASDYLAKVEAEESRADEERKKKLEELQKSTNQAYIGGKFLWPLPSNYTTVSCGFGWRIHPVTGRQQFHNGIDIPAKYGTEIYACNSGTVVEVSYNYADGNYVTISHGGGVASFYSHISKSAVKVGDKVTRGQVIAYVGTSGYVTGAHLNLNIYEYGTAVDPMGYFK